jgi:DNA-binding protein H-NS
MAIDLDKLSPQELDALISAAGEKKKRLQRERIGEVRRKLIALAKEEGYSIEELFGEGSRTRVSGNKGRSVPAKYRNPGDPTQTWSGRGKRPRWFIDALDRGKKESDLLIG